MRSQQEIFDIVVAHLRSQPKRAVWGGSCRYRTEDGLKCAVGVLIPDEMYTPLMECGGIYTLLHRKDDGLFSVPIEVDTYRTMLAYLQSVHDYEVHWGPSGFIAENRLAEAASKFDLVLSDA